MIDQGVLSDDDLRGATGAALARAAWAAQRDDGALEAYDMQGPTQQYIDNWIRWYANERNAGRPPDLSRLRSDQAVIEPRYGSVPSIGPVSQPEPGDGEPRYSIEPWMRNPRPPEAPIVSRPPVSQPETGQPAPAVDFQQHLLTRDEYDPEVQSWTDDERMRWYQTGERPSRAQPQPPTGSAPIDVGNPPPPSSNPPVAEPPMPGRGGEPHTPEPLPPQNPEPPVHVVDVNLDTFNPLDDLARMGPDNDSEPDNDEDDISRLTDEERRRRRPGGNRNA